MRIIDEIQLDFDDVLIAPQRSTLNSRADVNPWRDFSEEGHGARMFCIPIVAANMGTVGTVSMARKLSIEGYMCALEKHIPEADILELFRCLDEGQRKRVLVSIGVKESLDGINFLVRNGMTDFAVNIDVPNGYIPKLKERVELIRSILPKSFIVAGTVVTADAAQDLILAGANCVRCGIGCGCFVGDTMITTETGLKKIRDVCIGDKVLTHTGKFEPVTNKFQFNTHEYTININGIECTPNHRFYVVDVKDLDKITEQNYQQYAFWVEADKLDEKRHRLIKIS